MIPLSIPNLNGNEKKYILDAIDSEWVSTGGSYITRLENEVAHYVKVNEAVACQSGTSGLHLALLLSGVNTNDEVIVPTLTFIAAVNPVKYVGAFPIFIDCDDSLTIDADKIEQFIKEECEYKNNILINKTSDRIIKAIVVVHVFGNTANMEKIMSLAKQYHLRVIEDATEALGTYYTEGLYKGQYLGTIGDFGVYSFNGNKIITTGGGGMLVTKSPKFLKKAKYLSTQAKDDELNYIHNEVGYNYRMTNLQAALGVAQLEQLETFIETKTRNYKLYQELLKDEEKLELLPFNDDIRPNYWFYSILLKDIKLDRATIIDELQKEGIQTRPIWGLIHEQKPYQDAYYYKIEKATYYHKSIINVPCSTNLTEDQVKEVVNKLCHIIHS